MSSFIVKQGPELVEYILSFDVPFGYSSSAFHTQLRFDMFNACCLLTQSRILFNPGSGTPHG